MFTLNRLQLGDDSALLNRITFFDEAIFHISYKVRRHQFSESENPHIVGEHGLDSSKVNVLCVVTLVFVIGSFISVEITVTATTPGHDGILGSASDTIRILLPSEWISSTLCQQLMYTKCK